MPVHYFLEARRVLMQLSFFDYAIRKWHFSDDEVIAADKIRKTLESNKKI